MLTQEQIIASTKKIASFKKGYEVLSTSFPSIFANVGKPDLLPLTVVRNTNLKNGVYDVHLTLDGDYVQLKYVDIKDKDYLLSDYAQLQLMYAIEADGVDPIESSPLIMGTVTKRHVDPTLTTDALKKFVDGLASAPRSLETVLEAREAGKNTDKMVTFQVLDLKLDE
jgi:hypothetical protein